ncbi:MAG: hypothetical protein ACD_44C00094G0008 [uncultured bacterium]|nr:MAG: hypothetical protein ACD_44C00094G0008 [uncultured bacterium]OGT15038.1 MAG: D-arabinose 5-phosphate isomerase [Gammaproteobacteria bacterium RIFCSPHIGHO2_02_FULL_38_33]OGT24286.1 MAG: D-arabinose 5-phosphate isomerase [Gammaproteobacteria bacterium RIFCSPHIGHO2_12_38_15]OGT67043.1 MAG: D-arabinose 5-phosphate isomerase [Gammaproteobacteria bacterium RIFCSPLOWO2_02_FULL_38_11]OGT77490.1 MAG: D-arabinose 5-phosphate isomerase [Gammaproteobacteria bacterium RIFCSPLOWO2_12_FULL_38_14]
METSAIKTSPSLTFCESGINTFELEIQALKSIAQRLDIHFERACQLLLQCTGKIIIMGIGKSGHIANKIAATFTSTGTPAFFVHPAEASHGDLGMLSANDILLVLSNSGETPEIISLLPAIKERIIPIIALTGNRASTLAQTADINLDLSIAREACPLNLAPTSSTTACLVMGDALAIALLKAKGFTTEDFASIHPGGFLGRRLLLRVDHLMHQGEQIPKVSPETSLAQALIEITNKRLGMAVIVDKENKILGIFTDGDLRRTLEKHKDIHAIKMSDIMTQNCKTVKPSLLAAEALYKMKQHKITSLLITDDENKLQGIIHLHDLLQRGMS